jgi:hypothetical protein
LLSAGMASLTIMEFSRHGALFCGFVTTPAKGTSARRKIRLIFRIDLVYLTSLAQPRGFRQYQPQASEARRCLL